MERDAMPHQQWLVEFVEHHGGVAGSVHVIEDGTLVLRAAHNLPPRVVAAVAVVSKGKGMAGLAFERAQPVQTCNLQTDHSGDVQPGARAVDAEAAIAIPVSDTCGAVRAVVGIAFVGEREIASDEIARLTSAAHNLLPLMGAERRARGDD